MGTHSPTWYGTFLSRRPRAVSPQKHLLSLPPLLSHPCTTDPGKPSRQRRKKPRVLDRREESRRLRVKGDPCGDDSLSDAWCAATVPERAVSAALLQRQQREELTQPLRRVAVRGQSAVRALSSALSVAGTLAEAQAALLSTNVQQRWSLHSALGAA